MHLFSRKSADLQGIRKTDAAFHLFWSTDTYDEVLSICKRQNVDLLHVHNTFPLISPSIYYAARKLCVPVVQTLHNYRLLCPQAMFLRGGALCEKCLNKLPWRAIAYRCYHDSVSESAALSAMLTIHHWLGTYQRCIDRFIALSEFSRDKFVEGGLPRVKMAVKPNFVDIPKASPIVRSGGLFAGRISPEKGTRVLAEAVACRNGPAIDVVGAGADASLLKEVPRLRLLGLEQPEALYLRMQRAAYLVVPSIVYEHFPRIVVEAFACGLPVIASRIGALADIVEEGRTGLLFEAGNPRDLAEKLDWADRNPEVLREMGNRAREQYEGKYTSAKNYSQLMQIYATAMHERRSANPNGA